MTYETAVLFCKEPATTEIYTLSLHDALPISRSDRAGAPGPDGGNGPPARRRGGPRRGHRAARSTDRPPGGPPRSEEHTSELQSRGHLVCRLLLEKKKGCKVPRLVSTACAVRR